MRRLWVAAALAPLTFAASAAHAACTTTLGATTCSFSGTSSTPIDTKTVNSGSAANISIDSSGAIVPNAPTTPPTSPLVGVVTLDSGTSTVPNTITNNGGLSYPAGTNYAVGVQADTGVTGEVINAAGGGISLAETTTNDSTNQNIAWGPFANGTNRYGVYVPSGVGSFTGITDATNNTADPTGATAIFNAGSITIIGENSAGIYLAGSVAGDVINTGSITITGGSDNGTATTQANSGHVSYGILAASHIDGMVYTTGSISATGENATGLALNGGASAVVLGGSITATGYRSTANPGLTIAPALNAQQVLQGGPGVYIGGSVDNGVQLLGTQAASGSGSSALAAFSAGAITVYGSSPAILIGANGSTTTIGRVTNTLEGPQTADLVLGGTVDAEGVYDNRVTDASTTTQGGVFNATAIQIGGTNPLPFNIGGSSPGSTDGVALGSAFGAVSMNEGIDISGTVEANTLSTLSGNGNATGMIVGSGASVGSLTLEATGTLTANAQTAYTSTTGLNSAANGGTAAIALNVQTGGSLSSITNKGVISALISPIVTDQSNVGVYTGGKSVIAPIAINDLSGTITSIINQNTIEAADINPANALINPSGVNERGVAIDLRANTSGVTITQQAYAGTLPTGVTSITPTIIGDIYLGSGGANAEALNVTAGTVTGNISWGAGNNNRLTIDGTAASPVTVTGALAEATGGSLAVSVDHGALVMTAPTATATGGSTGTTGATATLNLSSLNIGSNGAITFVIDPLQASGTTTQFNVAGTTSFASGAKVNLAIARLPLPATTQTYILIADNTNAFQGTASAASLTGATPYLLAVTPTVTPTGSGGDVLQFTVGERAGSQLSALSAAERAEYDSLYSVLASTSASGSTSATDQAVLADLLSKTDLASFKKAYDQFLPDFAGGPFQTLELGQEAIYRAEDDVPIKLQTDERRGWVQEIGVLDHRDDGQSAGYNGGGFGMVGGLERATNNAGGAVGLTAAYVTGNVKDAAQSADGHLAFTELQAGAYWRSGGYGLNFDASVNGGWVWFDSSRMYLDQSAPDPTTNTTTSVSQTAASRWNGATLAGHLGVKAPFDVGRFYLRPEVMVDYYALYEAAHSEHGGGSDFDLSVSARTSQEALAQADLVIGANLGEVIRWRPELTIGYREVVEGGPASTTARFSGGSSFALSPDFNDKGGVLARLGVHAGGAYADFSADAGEE